MLSFSTNYLITLVLLLKTGPDLMNAKASCYYYQLRNKAHNNTDKLPNLVCKFKSAVRNYINIFCF